MKFLKCKACDYQTVIKFNFCPQCGFNQSKIYLRLRYLFGVGIISFVISMLCYDDNKLDDLGAVFLLVSLLSIFSAVVLWLKRLANKLYRKIIPANKNIQKEEEKQPPQDLSVNLNITSEPITENNTELKQVKAVQTLEKSLNNVITPKSEKTKKAKKSKDEKYFILKICLFFAGIACLALAFFLEKTSLYFWGGGIIFVIFFSNSEKQAISFFSCLAGIISLVIAYNTNSLAYCFIGFGLIILAAYASSLQPENNNENNSIFDISFNTNEEGKDYDDNYSDYKPKHKKRKTKSYVASRPQPTSVEVWTGNKTINFEYHDAEGNFTARKIKLYSIKQLDYDYLLIGYCYLRERRRDFRSDRTTGIIRYKKELYPTNEFIKKCINGEL